MNIYAIWSVWIRHENNSFKFWFIFVSSTLKSRDSGQTKHRIIIQWRQINEIMFDVFFIQFYLFIHPKIPTWLDCFGVFILSLDICDNEKVPRAKLFHSCTWLDWNNNDGKKAPDVCFWLGISACKVICHHSNRKWEAAECERWKSTEKGETHEYLIIK